MIKTSHVSWTRKNMTRSGWAMEGVVR